ncbi:hypothetical protein [Frigoribacterium sp. VKM Ac-2836]|uniref:hypothetical protein n=1 Tax=Frigoribacterium sp. VKM Ac-2836 TaxID=2739014 RepID=UPI001567773D|nr:hypothetical protein [Frigoribacterium sp. VKM Ac-2836]NRD27769.1 hypothetical protein [Frigoribacterium sp. VKM Ac-2836]
MSDRPHPSLRGHTDRGVDSADDRQEARAGFGARLHDIEARPLASRAEAFGQIHDELRAVLEGTPDGTGQGGR